MFFLKKNQNFGSFFIIIRKIYDKVKKQKTKQNKQTKNNKNKNKTKKKKQKKKTVPRAKYPLYDNDKSNNLDFPGLLFELFCSKNCHKPTKLKRKKSPI